MRRHPIILGIFLLFIIIVTFSLFIYGLTYINGDRSSFSLKEKVGVVNVEGTITDSQNIVELLDEFGKDDSIKAVVLRINSPGGGVAPSQEIYNAVIDLKKKKKVVASMGSIAASGGYLIACAADKIVANPGTITGSIAAVMHFANAEELLKKVGLKTSVIKSGKYKDIGSPVREMTEEEKELVQGLVDDIYDQFLETVARDRRIAKEDLRKIADGRVFSGRQAQKLGLIDFLGDMGYAVRLAGKISGIKDSPDTIYHKKKGTRFWDYILQEAISSFIKEIRGKEINNSIIHYIYEYEST